MKPFTKIYEISLQNVHINLTPLKMYKQLYRLVKHFHASHAYASTKNPSGDCPREPLLYVI